jgi:hypothetical protein
MLLLPLFPSGIMELIATSIIEIIDALNLQKPPHSQKIVREVIKKDRELFLRHADDLEEISLSKHSLVFKYHTSKADYVQNALLAFLIVSDRQRR